jgi:hypothetical protein
LVALASTTTTLTQHRAGSRPQTLLVVGILKPAPPASGEHVVVKYASKAVARVACRTGQSLS